MKEIKAIIRPQRLSAVREALRKIPNFPGMTVIQAEGLTAPSKIGETKQTVRTELNDYTAKTRLIIVAPDEQVTQLLEVITRHASTGHIGDGLVWVTPVEHVTYLHAGNPTSTTPL